MARKAKNNFGGKGFKGFDRADQVGKIKAPGTYPFDRRYGSSITRTVIEKYDLDSNWAKWRRGYEYYNQAAWLPFQVRDPVSRELRDAELKSFLYQGDFNPTDNIEVMYNGRKFATLKADSGNHYAIKRNVVDSPPLGFIDRVDSNFEAVTDIYHPDHKYFKDLHDHHEIRAHSQSFHPLMLRMVGDRVSDGFTSATLNYVLNENNHPALYRGKSHPKYPTQLQVVVETAKLLESKPVVDANGDLNALAGELGFLEDFYQIRKIPNIASFEYEDIPVNTLFDGDKGDYFGVKFDLTLSGQKFRILDQSRENFPPSMLDISELPTLVPKTEKNQDSDTIEGIDAEVTTSGTYVYQKALYQRFFGNQYLGVELVRDEVEYYGVKLFPFTILSLLPRADGTTVIEAIPFVSELELYAADLGPDQDGWSGSITFDDRSFTQVRETGELCDHEHLELDPPDQSDIEEEKRTYKRVQKYWRELNIDVDPWMETVFLTRRPLLPDTLYTCSCPAYGKSILRMPETTENREQRKTNRQMNYPLPTVLGKERFDGLGVNNAAGIIESWESKSESRRYKMCKHTVASMFIDHLKVKEPNSYPSIETRKAFEDKLKADIAEVQDRFYLSLERGEITTTEIIFALAQGLNLDDIELAYVMFNSKF